MTMGVPVDLVAAYRAAINDRLLDLNRRDRLGLLAELDRMLGELPPGVRPRSALGATAEMAQTLRAAAGLPDRVRLRQRLRRSPWWIKLVLAGCFLATALVVWFALTTARYELAHGTTGYFAGDENVEAGYIREARYEYLAGRIFRVGFSVQNPGSWPIRVLGFPDRYGPGMTSIAGACVTDANHFTEDSCKPFTSVEIRAGDERMFYLDIRMTPCDEVRWARSPGSTSTRESIPIKFEVLGVNRVQDLELRNQLLTIYTTEASVRSCGGHADEARS